MRINEFFQKKLRVKIKNPRWSWGAIDPHSNRVFLKIWADQIKKAGSGNRVEIFWKRRDRSSPGSSERLEHIRLIKAGAEGIGIVCEVANPSPIGPRHIKSFDENTLYRLGRFTEDKNLIYVEVKSPILLKELIRPKAGRNTLAKDLKEILENKRRLPTTKEALVNARIGQGEFRTMVLQRWEQRCAVTGSTTLDAIRASHIKPWRHSNDEERLDPQNGLPLIANLDALFDAGLISFDASGCILISSKLSRAERDIYGLDRNSLSKRPSSAAAVYLEYHRTELFRK